MENVPTLKIYENGNHIKQPLSSDLMNTFFSQAAHPPSSFVKSIFFWNITQITSLSTRNWTLSNICRRENGNELKHHLIISDGFKNLHSNSSNLHSILPVRHQYDFYSSRFRAFKLNTSVLQ